MGIKIKTGQILIFKIVNHPFFWVATCDPHGLVMVMHLALLQGPPEPKQEVPELQRTVVLCDVQTTEAS